jgi:hypothetical protein
MIQRLSDEQKYDLVRDFEKTLINAGATEIAHATSDFLCGINTADRFYIPQLEKMQEEIATLTAKHERLVKASYKFNGYILMNPVKGFDVPDDIYKPFVKALTESEGE